MPLPELVALEEDRVLVDVGGVGYGIFMSGSSMGMLPPVGNEVKIHTYLNVKEDAVASENSNTEVIKQQYVNIIAVKEGNENKDAIKTLVDILKSDAIVKYINDTYNGSVIPFK